MNRRQYLLSVHFQIQNIHAGQRQRAVPVKADIKGITVFEDPQAVLHDRNEAFREKPCDAVEVAADVARFFNREMNGVVYRTGPIVDPRPLPRS